jgi:DNA-binding MarR family transcriptional regulator
MTSQLILTPNEAAVLRRLQAAPYGKGVLPFSGKTMPQLAAEARMTGTDVRVAIASLEARELVVTAGSEVRLTPAGRVVCDDLLGVGLKSGPQVWIAEEVARTERELDDALDATLASLE